MEKLNDNEETEIIRHLTVSALVLFELANCN